MSTNYLKAFVLTDRVYDIADWGCKTNRHNKYKTLSIYVAVTDDAKIINSN